MQRRFIFWRFLRYIIFPFAYISIHIKQHILFLFIVFTAANIEAIVLNFQTFFKIIFISKPLKSIYPIRVVGFIGFVGL